MFHYYTLFSNIMKNYTSPAFLFIFHSGEGELLMGSRERGNLGVMGFEWRGMISGRGDIFSMGIDTFL